MSTDIPSNIIADIRFIGRTGGAVKKLGGFKKGHHTLPDAANEVTNSFLGRLCTRELEEEAEGKFQAVRTGLDYKRKDIALTVTSPIAVLSAKDFTFEIMYELDEDAPDEFAVTQTLLDLKNGALADVYRALFHAKEGCEGGSRDRCDRRTRR